jgi:transposase-like protein
VVLLGGILFVAEEGGLNRAGFAGGSNSRVGWSIMSKTTNKYSPEVRERAVRMVLDNAGQHESRWSAILSISSKIGCAPQTLNEWVKKAEVDRGDRAGITTEMAEKLKALERENRELKEANEILRKASAYFAQAELDRRSRT